MERLIDADALKEAMNQNGACGICLRYVDDADTINAIPVEWVRKFCKDDVSEEQRETIEWMLKAWQQEAR